MKHSESVSKIALALVAVAQEIENPTKNAANPHFKSRYADLAEIINTSREVLAKHGLVVVQSPGMEDGDCTVESLVLHNSGEWIQGVARSPLQKNDPQGVGSAITYLRRYSLAALLGLAQEDDDGNAGSAVGRDQRTGEKHAPHANGNGSAAKTGDPTCPRCNSGVWDNRASKPSPRSPDYKCKSKECDWALWIDRAKSELKGELEKLANAGVIQPASVGVVMKEVEGGDLDALLKALDYLHTKQGEVGKKIREAEEADSPFAGAGR